MPRFNRHKWWILTVALTAPVVALAAGVPNVFTPGTPISSAQVNANFTNLADRVTALEASLAKTTKVTIVMDNVPGPLGTLGKSAALQTSGGPLVVIVSGSSYWSAVGTTMDVAVQIDGTTIGHLKAYTNEASSHKAFPTRAFHVPTLAAGAHTVGVLNGNTTTTNDMNDYFSITVVETAH